MTASISNSNTGTGGNIQPPSPRETPHAQAQAQAQEQQLPLSQSQYTITSETTSENHPSRHHRKRRSHASKRIHRRVSNSRWLFLACLAAVAALLGAGAYVLLSNAEDTLALEQYESLSDRALTMSLDIAMRKRQGIVTLASMASHGFPNASTWPYIQWGQHGSFEVVSNHLIATATGDAMSILPIVTPTQLTTFEDFAAPLYPETNITTVTGLDGFLQRYNESETNPNGTTHWNSSYRYFAPFLYSSRGPILFLSNYHSIEDRGRELDEVMECSQERAQQMQANAASSSSSSSSYIPMECSLVTGISDLSNRQRKPMEPASVLLYPIYPANDPAVLVGFITSTIKWHDTLLDVFSDQVSGVDCVLQTETQVYTYQVTAGNISLKGEGDWHDTDFTSFGQSIALHPPGLYSLSSPNYTLTLYPTQEFFDVYTTPNPMAATIGAVCIVILTALSFFLYDFFVREEFSHKDALDHARRQFVRFISHEVRTPLNAVCMGLQLQQNEAKELITTLNNNNNGIAANTQDGDAAAATTTTTTTTLNESSNGEEREETTKVTNTAVHISATAVQDRLMELTDLGNDILSNASSAVDVLNDLLNYDKIESGTLKLELTVIPIWELVEQTFLEFQQQAQFNDIHYILDWSGLLLLQGSDNDNDDNDEEEQAPGRAVPPGMSALNLPQNIKNAKVIGDKVRISQVLRNLISNALKFSNDDDILTIRPYWKRNTTSQDKHTEITLQSGEKNMYLSYGDLHIEVEDTGHGMTKEQLNSLFREGVQFNVNELQAGQGSGLGLYIAKGILEQHGGSMTATSEGIGCGTQFDMTLPLYYIPDPPESDQSANKVATRPRTDVFEKVEPLRVLVVDDSNVNRKLLSRLLQNQGHLCNQAEDGAAAVQCVKAITAESSSSKSRYDAILMDYEMPTMDGPTAAKAIRALGSDSFIVGITGNLFPEDVAYFKECGANIVLPKPLDMGVLMDAFMEHRVSTLS